MVVCYAGPEFTTGVNVFINNMLVYAQRPTLAMIAAICLIGLTFSTGSSAIALDYPASKTGDTMDDYHGVQVADPYRWLEDPDSEETRRWVKAEQALSTSYLETLPERAAIRARLGALWNYEKVGVPVQEGGRLFYTLNPGLLNQARLMWREAKGGEATGGDAKVREATGGVDRVLLAPNTLSTDGTAALASWSVSRDGKHVYVASPAGDSVAVFTRNKK